MAASGLPGMHPIVVPENLIKASGIILSSIEIICKLGVQGLSTFSWIRVLLWQYALCLPLYWAHWLAK